MTDKTNKHEEKKSCMWDCIHWRVCKLRELVNKSGFGHKFIDSWRLAEICKLFKEEIENVLQNVRVHNLEEFNIEE